MLIPDETSLSTVDKHVNLWHYNWPHDCVVQQFTVLLTSCCPGSLHSGGCTDWHWTGSHWMLIESLSQTQVWQAVVQLSPSWLKERDQFRRTSYALCERVNTWAGFPPVWVFHLVQHSLKVKHRRQRWCFGEYIPRASEIQCSAESGLTAGANTRVVDGVE